jgi:UDP-N-acetylglucosamine--N-acetylmuramyl-(pentapeptide) pyrophosphoryl-undecaprenol N-acetylglucosamine transferase
MRILAVSGASGGDIFPALSFLEALKRKYSDSQNLLVIPKRYVKIQSICQDYSVKFISICPIGFSLTRSNLAALLNFLRGSLESLGLLVDFKPDVVIGFGGLETVPVVLFAWIFRIKTLIHEQNVLPGKANRFLAKFCDKVAVSFAETKKLLNISKNRIILTGNPVIQRMRPVAKKQALDFFGFTENKLTILVIGGSQGSHSINLAFLETVFEMSANYKLQVIHITGAKDFEFLTGKYKELSLSVNIKVFSFLNEMHYAYSASDIVVTRAGATTIAELMFFKMPSVIIPYPFAYNHQRENARVLEKSGVAVVIEDNEKTGARLRGILDDFIKQPQKIKAMGYNFNNSSLNYQAADFLVDIALQ